MKKLIEWITSTSSSDRRLDVGLLILRLGSGGFIAFLHGWGKLTSFGTRMEKFSDPLGVGSALSLSMTVFGEFFCGLALILGLATRAAAGVQVAMMLVIAFLVHGSDPWNKQEFALLYAIPFLTLFFTGAGRYSLDAKLFRRG